MGKTFFLAATLITLSAERGVFYRINSVQICRHRKGPSHRFHPVRQSKPRRCRDQATAAQSPLAGCAKSHCPSCVTTQRRHQAAVPSQGAEETRWRRRVQAAPSSSGVDSGKAKSTQHRHQAAGPSKGAGETRRSLGGAESWRRQVPAVLPSAAETRRQLRVQAAPSASSVDKQRRLGHQAAVPSKGAAETRRRLRVQAAPSPSYVATQRRYQAERRAKALQRPCDSGAESRRRQVPAQRRHQAAAPSQGAEDTRRQLRRIRAGRHQATRRTPARHLAFSSPALKQACEAANRTELSAKTSVRQIHSTMKNESLHLFSTLFHGLSRFFCPALPYDD